MPFSNLASNTRQGLHDLAALVTDVHPDDVKSFRFRTGALVPGAKLPDFVDALEKWPAEGQHIYVFRTEASPKVASSMHGAFEAAKKAKKGGRAYARLSKPSPVLYVGGSLSLRTRIVQHLGYGTQKVYAMQLAYWASPADVEVELLVAKYKRDIHVDVIGALEDSLWTQLQPMFGRKGRK